MVLKVGVEIIYMAEMLPVDQIFTKYPEERLVFRALNPVFVGNGEYFITIDHLVETGHEKRFHHILRDTLQ